MSYTTGPPPNPSTGDFKVDNRVEDTDADNMSEKTDDTELYQIDLTAEPDSIRLCGEDTRITGLRGLSSLFPNSMDPKERMYSLAVVGGLQYIGEVEKSAQQKQDENQKLKKENMMLRENLQKLMKDEIQRLGEKHKALEMEMKSLEFVMARLEVTSRVTGKGENIEGTAESGSRKRCRSGE